MLPRANLKGKIDLIPIIKDPLDKFPDKLYIFYPNNIIERSKNEYLFLRLFYKIFLHLKFLLEVSFDIFIVGNNILDILYNIYLKFWNEYKNLIPPKRRFQVEKSIYNWLKTNTNNFNSEIINFLKNYFKLSIKSLNWYEKTKLWHELKKIEQSNYNEESTKQIYLQKYMDVWYEFIDKIHLSSNMNPELRQKLMKKLEINLKIFKKIEKNNIKIEKMKFCPICGALAKGKFCFNCGYNLELKRIFCSNCGAEIDDNSIIFCPNCGIKL